MKRNYKEYRPPFWTGCNRFLSVFLSQKVKLQPVWFVFFRFGPVSVYFWFIEPNLQTLWMQQSHIYSLFLTTLPTGRLLVKHRPVDIYLKSSIPLTGPHVHIHIQGASRLWNHRRSHQIELTQVCSFCYSIDIYYRICQDTILWTRYYYSSWYICKPTCW